MGFQDSRWNISLSSLVICIGFLRYRVEKQTDTQINGGKNHTPATAFGVGNKQTNTDQNINPRSCGVRSNDTCAGEFRQYLVDISKIYIYM